MNQKQVILFGLNADPPHLGHLEVIHEVEKALGQEALFVVMPSGGHPFAKAQHASPEQRLAMTKLLCAGHSQVRVDDFEIKKEGISYTLESLQYLKGQYKEARLYFIMAEDAASKFFLWHEPEKILALATPIIVSRIGYTLEPEVKKRLGELCHPLILQTHAVAISSTQIRADLKGHAHYLLPTVLKFIQEHHLYA